MQEEPSHKGLSFRIFEKEKEKRVKQKRDQVDVKLTLCWLWGLIWTHYFSGTLDCLIPVSFSVLLFNQIPTLTWNVIFANLNLTIITIMIIDIFSSKCPHFPFPHFRFWNLHSHCPPPPTVFPRNTCETQEAVVPFQESDWRKRACKEPLLMHIRANLSVFTNYFESHFSLMLHFENSLRKVYGNCGNSTQFSSDWHPTVSARLRCLGALFSAHNALAGGGDSMRQLEMLSLSFGVTTVPGLQCFLWTATAADVADW